MAHLDPVSPSLQANRQGVHSPTPIRASPARKHSRAWSASSFSSFEHLSQHLSASDEDLEEGPEEQDEEEERIVWSPGSIADSAQSFYLPPSTATASDFMSASMTGSISASMLGSGTEDDFILLHNDSSDELRRSVNSSTSTSSNSNSHTRSRSNDDVSNTSYTLARQAPPTNTTYYATTATTTSATPVYPLRDLDERPIIDLRSLSLHDTHSSPSPESFAPYILGSVIDLQDFAVPPRPSAPAPAPVLPDSPKPRSRRKPAATPVPATVVTVDPAPATAPAVVVAETKTKTALRKSKSSSRKKARAKAGAGHDLPQLQVKVPVTVTEQPANQQAEKKKRKKKKGRATSKDASPASSPTSSPSGRRGRKTASPIPAAPQPAPAVAPTSATVKAETAESTTVAPAPAAEKAQPTKTAKATTGAESKSASEDEVAAGLVTSMYDSAVGYITSFLSSPDAALDLSDARSRLTLLQALIIELGLYTPSPSRQLSSPAHAHANLEPPSLLSPESAPFLDLPDLPHSVTAARSLLKSRVFLNVRDYLAARAEGPAALRRVMHPSRNSLVRELRSRKGRRASLGWVKRSGLGVLLISAWHH